VTHLQINGMHVHMYVHVCVCVVDIKGHSLLGGTLKDFWGFPSDYQNYTYLTCAHMIYCFSFVTQLRQSVEQTYNSAFALLGLITWLHRTQIIMAVVFCLRGG
jgi:hypothetical protein